MRASRGFDFGRTGDLRNPEEVPQRLPRGIRERVIGESVRWRVCMFLSVITSEVSAQREGSV